MSSDKKSKLKRMDKTLKRFGGTKRDKKKASMMKKSRKLNRK